MNLHRAIVAVLLSQVVQGHASHPAADSAKSPQKTDEELTEDEAAVAKLTEDEQASAASAQAGVHNTVPWKGVGAETIDVGVIVSSSAARRDRRRQMKDGKRTSSLVWQKGTKNRRLQMAPYDVCGYAANTFYLDDTIAIYNPYYEINRIEDAPPGIHEISIDEIPTDDPYYTPELTMALYGRAVDANDCEQLAYGFYRFRQFSAVKHVVRLELEVATSLTLGFYGYGDFEVTHSFSPSKSSKSNKSRRS